MSASLLKELCNGPALVVDNEVASEHTGIAKLVNCLRQEGFPVISCCSVEDARRYLPCLSSIGFVILDWQFVAGLSEEWQETGSQLGLVATKAEERNVVDLIKNFQEQTLAPIFLLTNQNVEGIKTILRDAGVNYATGGFVFVRAKEGICDDYLEFESTVDRWIQENPHIYLAKTVLRRWLEASHRAFWGFLDSCPVWPSLCYKAFLEDGDDPNVALLDTVLDLVLSNFDFAELDGTVLAGTTEGEANTAAIRSLHGSLAYIKNEELLKGSIVPGDIFRTQDNGKVYWLNIRPACDTTARSDKPPKVYLLRGQKIKDEDFESRFDTKYHRILEKENEMIFYNLDEHDAVMFNMRNLTVKKPDVASCGVKIARLSRALAVSAQQRYAAYLSRQGTPAYPKGLG